MPNRYKENNREVYFNGAVVALEQMREVEDRKDGV